MYKIIAKILAETLKRVIDKVINPHQMAFTKGRQIMDATMLASECADTRLRGSEPGMMCRLDIKRAFDHINWKLFLSILRQTGFGRRWLNWLSFCIKTTRCSILVIGEPNSFFIRKRIKPRGPLIPFLFIIAMEGINSMMKIAIQRRWLNGSRIGSRTEEVREICHLLYADDTIVFCDATSEQISFWD